MLAAIRIEKIKPNFLPIAFFSFASSFRRHSSIWLLEICILIILELPFPYAWSKLNFSVFYSACQTCISYTENYSHLPLPVHTAGNNASITSSQIHILVKVDAHDFHEAFKILAVVRAPQGIILQRLY